ncbi:TPA: collagen-like protein, partial [Streptococcus pyogenes]|nr:collagen-like protein [Streptococcus pyogenes]
MNKTKQNKTKQNKTKQNKTKQNKTKHSLLCRYGLTSAAALLLTFGGASAVKADGNSKSNAEERAALMEKLNGSSTKIDQEEVPKVPERYETQGLPDVTTVENDISLIHHHLQQLKQYLETRKQDEKVWREELFKGIQQRLLGGEQGERGPAGPQGPRGDKGEKGEQGLPG